MRIGMLSFAHLHAEGYQALLRAIPGVELVGFSHEEAEEGRHFAAEYGLRWYPSHQELLAEGLDGVVVCSENARHRELVEMAAEARCHVLCEKPIATRLEDARAMQAACERNGVHFMTAFPMRFAPSAQALRSAIRQGQLGWVYGVNGINHSEIPKAHRAWFADGGLAGGGAVMDHVVHLADLLRWYFGAEATEVYAEVDNLFYPGAVEVDTAGLLLLSLSNGVQASIDCSWSRPTWYPRWGHLKMEVVGERGALVLDAFAQYVTLYARNAPRKVSWVGFGPDPNRGMLEEFVASIRERRPPAVTWNDGYQALRVALAAYESAQAKEPVRLSG
ncbi:MULTISPECIES: Gfo/Idh/MocA family protein [unclassified Meiothermus]|uniref:Gfo/Idh/MocA family protein n=1 Tax=unclassified Meiothermus TaxID=370471 RepID=UPI000D7CF51E|nr:MULTISPECIES: Gfo/Idh/MocA family oxidoreductase [unclassified Meiothermus]PZA07333.1 gfo/Idh/MocA family oxidoreductase [Meiothermus sp. Pnk-1]RYM37327.1 Gfo/Idh/MocA family oxidoreductase [Meiothermus sp. PNK-Is4]